MPRSWVSLCAVVLAGIAATSAGAGAARRPAQTLPPFPAISPRCHRADFRSQGGTVRAALCRPDGSAPVGAVVVLHGCGGFGGIDQVLARDLPAHGVATYYVDYFGLTPAPSNHGFCGAGPEMERAFATWQRLVLDAKRALQRTPGIDPSRIGVLGWSLGGGLALTTAEYGAGTTPLRHSPFRVLVVLSAYDDGGPVSGLPPTLVLSGGSRDAVPVADAVALYRSLRQARVPAVLHVYRHGTHNWKGPQRIAGENWVFAFLGRYLALR